MKLSPILKGLFLGTIVVLSSYSLLNENLRFSRAILILGAFWSLISLSCTRLFLHYFKYKNFDIEKPKTKRIAIVGSEQEIVRVQDIILKSHLNPQFIGWVCHTEHCASNDYLGNLNQLEEIIKIHKIDEVILCAKDISSQLIISNMVFTEESNVEFKIAPPESHFIIGSNSIDSPGELYLIDLNSLNQLKNRRSKRIFDVVMSVLLVFLSPILILFIKSPINLFTKLKSVFKGECSWVGYSPTFISNKEVPKLKKGILTPCDVHPNKQLNEAQVHELNIQYVKEYSIFHDFKILVKGIKKIAQ